MLRSYESYLQIKSLEPFWLFSDTVEFVLLNHVCTKRF